MKKEEKEEKERRIKEEDTYLNFGIIVRIMIL